MKKSKQVTVELCSKHDTSDLRVSYEVGDLTDWHTLDLGALYLEPMELRIAKVKINFQVGSPLDMKVKFSKENEGILKNTQIKIGDLETPVVFPLRKLND
jgi:hypothetical protein